MAFQINDLIPSVGQFLAGWRVVRICPDRIIATAEQLSLNFLALAVSLLLFMLARGTIAGSDPSELGANIAATMITAGITFVTGYVRLIWDSSEEGMQKARKWGMFFVYLWMTSLLVVIIIDGIPIWNHAQPLTSIVINTIFGQGTLPALAKNTLRGILIGSISLAIMLIKTRFMDPDFKTCGICSIITVAIGLIENVFLLLLFLYGNFV